MDSDDEILNEAKSLSDRIRKEEEEKKVVEVPKKKKINKADYMFKSI